MVSDTEETLDSMEAESAGETFWREISPEPHSGTRISDEEIADLREKVKKTLANLPTMMQKRTSGRAPFDEEVLEAYKDFCREAGSHSRFNLAKYAEEIFPGLPLRITSEKENSLDELIVKVYNKVNSLTVLMGAGIGFFGVSILIGHVADNFTDNKTVVYTLNALGAGIGGLAGGRAGHLLVLPVIHYLKSKRQKQGGEEDRIFMEEIERYIQER